MRDQEIIGLWEAYHQVYAPQEITEEVEIAAQYFYEMGLNEDGVDILIEDLGVEEFADWVYEIAEDYTLTEARAGGVRVEPKTKAGKSVGQLKGGAKTAAINRLRKEKEARRSAEASSSAAKPSGLKSSLQRQSAVANAQKKQPEKSGSAKGIAGRIGAALGSAVKRAKSDIELTKKTAQTVSKAVGTGVEALNRASDSRLARQARVATHKGVKRHTQALSAAGGALGKALGASTARRRSQSEGFEFEDMFDYLLEYLVAEGYADTNKAALAIMANMSEEWKASIVEETRRTEYLQKKFDKENAKKSGAAHTAIPGKQNTGQALSKARQSERHMRGEN